MQERIDEVFAEKMIPADDSVRLIDQIVGEMELNPLMRAYSYIGRKPETPPRALIKVMVYAGMEHVHSARRIWKACLRDMNFIWLLDGEEAPSYHEIARFRSRRLGQCAEELFYQFVEKR